MLSCCDTMAKFSINLARIMREGDINQVELAKKSGISQPRISGYLSESKYAKFPSLKNLIKLARALHVSLEELTGLESLRGMEQKVEALKDGAGSLSPKGREFARLYNNITDESKKELIEAMIIKAAESKAKSESHDTEESENKDEK